MKAMVNHHNSTEILNTGTIFLKENGSLNRVKIVNYNSNFLKQQYEILLHSELFIDQPVKINIKENKLNIVVSELVDISQRAQLPHYDWQSYYHQSYTRMRNITIYLPGDNFFLLKSFLIPEKFLLKIIVGQLGFVKE